MYGDLHRDMWDDMKNGDLNAVLRIRLDIQSTNGCMRDPTIYRVVNQPHQHTGDRYKVYPTYDFACPIVDVMEGVTHVFRSTEFVDRDEQYTAILKLLTLPCPELDVYSKLIFKDAVLSKRKIKELIANKVIGDWDSPKLLTWRGAKRHGLTVQGLIQFLAKIGISKSVVEMDQIALWTANRKVIDRISTRFMAIKDRIEVQVVFEGVEGVEGVDEVAETQKDIVRFRRNPDLGSRPIYYSGKIYLELEEYNELEDGEEVTLVNWGNAFIKKGDRPTLTLHLEGDFKTTKHKLVWVSASGPHIPTITHVFSYSYNIMDEPMFTLLTGEHDISNVKKGDFIQIMRKHYYICDRNDKTGLFFIELPK